MYISQIVMICETCPKGFAVSVFAIADHKSDHENPLFFQLENGFERLFSQWLTTNPTTKKAEISAIF